MQTFLHLQKLPKCIIYAIIWRALTVHLLYFCVFQDTFLFHGYKLQLCGPSGVFFPQAKPPHAFLTVLYSEVEQCHL